MSKLVVLASTAVYALLTACSSATEAPTIDANTDNVVHCPPTSPDGGQTDTTVSDSGWDVKQLLDCGYDTIEASDAADANDSLNYWPPGTGPIVYYGGPIVDTTPNVYLIWYGNWSGSGTPAIIENLIKNFGGSSYSNILTSYYQVPQASPLPDAGGVLYLGDGGFEASTNEPDTGTLPDASIADVDVSDGPKTYVTGQFNLVGSYYVGYYRGKTLSYNDVERVVLFLLKDGTLPYDSSGIYVVLTSTDVQESEYFGYYCTDFCGWHEGVVANNSRVQYVFVGDPGLCLDNCSIKPEAVALGYPNSPNNNWAADSMASVIIHELSETVTDPYPTSDQAWMNAYKTAENGDMCAWRFEPTFPVGDGGVANTTFGSENYLIQQMWVKDDDAGGHCGLHP